MRVLDVAPRPVFPARRGMEVRIAALGRELSRRHDVRHLTMAAGRPRRGRALATTTASPSQLQVVRAHPVSELALGAGELFWHRAQLLAGLAMRLSSVAAIAPQFRWADVVVVEYPWQFDACRRLTPPGTPSVYSSVNVETDKFRSWGEAVGVSRAAAAPWLRYVERAERNAIARADLVTTVSEPDRETFIERFSADPARTIVVQNGVDSRRIRPATPAERAAAKRRLGLPDRPVVLFQGADMPANRAGLDWVRRLAAADERFTFLVVGDVAPPQRAAQLVAVGSVPDMRPYLAAAELAICPIAHGGGTKMKLFECMAAGLPTVAFEEAIRGTSVIPGEHVLVAGKEERGLRDALGTLATDERLAGSVARAARELAERRYDWTVIAPRLERALLELTGAPVTRDRPPPTTPPPTAARVGAPAAE